MQSIYQSNNRPRFEEEDFPTLDDEIPFNSSISDIKEKPSRPRFEDQTSFDSLLDTSFNSTKSQIKEKAPAEFTPTFESDIVNPIVSLNFLKYYKEYPNTMEIPNTFVSYDQYAKIWTDNLKNEVWAKMLSHK